MDLRSQELWLRVGEHLVLTSVSTAVAILLGIPLGILAVRHRRLRAAVLGLVGILQTIPSLAMLSLLLVLLGRIGVLPALIALSLYALLPIVRNVLAAFENIPSSIREAADGVGMSPRQRLTIVEIPLAIPIILAGVRTAAVVGVGIATLSAFIGAGGLGQFINRGLALARYDLVLFGALPAAALALLVDALLGVAAWGLRPAGSARARAHPRLRRAAALAPLALAVLMWMSFRMGPPARGGARPDEPFARALRIGSKNFTEQILIAEILAQLVESRTDLRVERVTNLGGTLICHQALVAGEIDLYVEYSGTAVTAILGLEIPEDPAEVSSLVVREYRERFDLHWLEGLGFDNTYALAVRREEAERRGWRTISDLAQDSGALRAGFTAEFAERVDGYRGLARAYSLELASVRDLDPALMYAALAKGEVDVIAAFATDGRIDAYDLLTLEDDRSYFPPYEAAPVARRDALERWPELLPELGSLAYRIDDRTMRRLNAQVDVENRPIRSVAREFLRSEGMLPDTAALTPLEPVGRGPSRNSHDAATVPSEPPAPSLASRGSRELRGAPRLPKIPPLVPNELGQESSSHRVSRRLHDHRGRFHRVILRGGGAGGLGPIPAAGERLRAPTADPVERRRLRPPRARKGRASRECSRRAA